MIAALRTDVAGDRLAVLLLVGVWAYIAVPTGLETLTGASGSPLSEAALALVTVVAAAIACVRYRQLGSIGAGWLVVFGLPSLYLVFRDAYNGGFSFHGLTYIVIGLGIAASRPSILVLRWVGVLAVVTAIVVIALGLVRPDAAIVHDPTRQEDKALVPAIGMLSGIFPQENNLGQFLALGMPLLYFVRRFWLRWAGVAVVVMATLWSSSRGSILTEGVVVLLMITFDLVRGVARSWIARAAQIAAAAICIVLPLLGWPDDAFTDRAGIWNTALPIWVERNPVFGLGSDWFSNALGSGISPLPFYASHGHNQFVQLAVTGGVVLVLLAAAQLVAVVRRNAHAPALVDNVATLVVVGMLVNGWLEFAFGYVDDVYFWPMTFPVLAVLLFRRAPVPVQLRATASSMAEIR